MKSTTRTLKNKTLPNEQNRPAEGPVVVIDTREPIFQRYDFTAFGLPLVTEKKLETGDYSIEGLEEIVAVERKTLDDLAKSITLDRFWAELLRAKENHSRFCVIVEGTIAQVRAGLYASAVKPAAILGACLTIGTRYGFPIIWAENRQEAISYTATYLRHCYELRAELLQENETKKQIKEAVQK